MSYFYLNLNAFRRIFYWSTKKLKKSLKIFLKLGLSNKKVVVYLRSVLGKV